MAFVTVPWPTEGQAPLLVRDVSDNNHLRNSFLGIGAPSLRLAKLLFGGIRTLIIVACVVNGMPMQSAIQLSYDIKTESLFEMATQDHWRTASVLRSVGNLHPALDEPVRALLLHLRLTRALSMVFGCTTGYVDGKSAWLGMMGSGHFTDHALQGCLDAINSPRQDSLALMLSASSDDMGEETSRCIEFVLEQFVATAAVTTLGGNL